MQEERIIFADRPIPEKWAIDICLMPCKLQPSSVGSSKFPGISDLVWSSYAQMLITEGYYGNVIG